LTEQAKNRTAQRPQIGSKKQPLREQEIIKREGGKRNSIKFSKGNAELHISRNRPSANYVKKPGRRRKRKLTGRSNTESYSGGQNNSWVGTEKKKKGGQGEKTRKIRLNKQPEKRRKSSWGGEKK